MSQSTLHMEDKGKQQWGIVGDHKQLSNCKQHRMTPRRQVTRHATPQEHANANTTQQGRFTARVCEAGCDKQGGRRPHAASWAICVALWLQGENCSVRSANNNDDESYSVEQTSRDWLSVSGWGRKWASRRQQRAVSWRNEGRSTTEGHWGWI